MPADVTKASQWLDDWERDVQKKLGLDHRDLAYLLGQRAYGYFLKTFLTDRQKVEIADAKRNG